MASCFMRNNKPVYCKKALIISEYRYIGFHETSMKIPLGTDLNLHLSYVFLNIGFTRHPFLFKDCSNNNNNNKGTLHPQKVCNGDGPRRAGRATGFFRVESAVGPKSAPDLSRK